MAFETATGNVVLFNDNETGSTNLACGAAFNKDAITGNIALIDRGTCPLITKVKNAQNAGAIAVIIINNGTGITGPVDSSITIPAIMISQIDGIGIKNEVIKNVQVNVTIEVAPSLDGDLDTVIKKIIIQ